MNRVSGSRTDIEFAAAHVIVVEQNTKTRTSSRAASSSSSSRLRICSRRRLARLRVAVHLDQPELLDRLRLAVLEHLEVGLLQVRDRLRLLVGDDDVDADEVDAAAEDGLLRRCCPDRRALVAAGAALPGGLAASGWPASRRRAGSCAGSRRP